MNDIAKSLRIVAENIKYTSGEHTARLLNDAADEIEQLRQQIAAMTVKPKINPLEDFYK